MCTCAREYVFVYIYTCMYMYMYMYLVCTWICICMSYIHRYNVCLYVSTYVCMYALYTCMYTTICTYLSETLHMCVDIIVFMYTSVFSMRAVSANSRSNGEVGIRASQFACFEGRGKGSNEVVIAEWSCDLRWWMVQFGGDFRLLYGQRQVLMLSNAAKQQSV